MRALGRVVRSGVGRRRVQTLVTGLATMMAVTASVLGGSLLVASSAPFDQAFAAQHGAQLSVQFDAGRTDSAQLAATAHAAGVTAAAGPFRTAMITPGSGSGVGGGGQGGGPITVVGRADPGGPVDDVALTAGRWVTGPGEIVLSADASSPDTRVGSTLQLSGLPGNPSLTVVGLARSVSRTADGWVTPAEAAALTAPGAAGGAQMLYRFADAGSTARVAADRAAVTAAVPAGAVTGAQSWLDVKQGTDRNTALFVPFLVAFGLLGVIMSILIVGNVVAGAVGVNTRRIGVLKAIGFTPGQVVRAYMGQALVPAAVGAVLGLVAGNLLTVPVLAATNQVYGTSGSGVAPWVDLAVLAGALGLAAVTAWAAALRAGRLRTVEALAVGHTPRPGRGQWAARLTARLPLPRPVGLGLAHPFARPARAAAMVAAIVFGAAAATFAVGIGSSLGQIQAAKAHDTADVQVVPQLLGADGTPPVGGGLPAAGQQPPRQAALDQAAVTRALRAQPGTASWFGTANTEVGVAGVTGSSTVTAFTGDASDSGYRMVSGSWFHGAGQAVVPTTFLTATGTRIGDTVTLVDHGTSIPVRLVGEVLDPHTQTMELLTDAATLAAAEPGLHPTEYAVKVTHGTDPAAYATALDAALKPLGATAQLDRAGGKSDVILALNALTAVLTLMLVATAGLGVLNAVVLDTRERVRDIGVHKALGMTPRQTVAMVLSSVLLVGVAGGAVGVPLGAALQSVVVPAMGRSAGITMPASVVDVLHAPELVLLGLGGVLIAVLGALLPAGWAARTRTAAALRSE